MRSYSKWTPAAPGDLGYVDDFIGFAPTSLNQIQYQDYAYGRAWVAVLTEAITELRSENRPGAVANGKKWLLENPASSPYYIDPLFDALDQRAQVIREESVRRFSGISI